jgi:predicted dinucleotide-binding enzyme
MRIAVIGTGMVGRALAGRLTTLGHDVAIGTRDVQQTLAHSDTDRMGNPPFAQWQQSNPGVRLLTFAEAGAHGEVVMNATSGAVSLAALEQVGSANLAGKVLIDIALPLERTEGMPTVHVSNADSLGEQIQRAFPAARVVKSLHTVFAGIMADPTHVPGHHNIFVAGDDAAAKDTVKTLLREFGWADDAIIDLGGLVTARATEAYMRLFFTLAGLFGSFNFNISIVRAA